jgi:NADH-quinone oxidoreductase subunit J
MDPNWFLLLYSIIALATLGLYLLLPKARQPSWPRIGAAMAGLALIALLIAMVRRVAGPLTPEYPWFIIISAAAVTSAVMMICQKRSLYAALCFVLTNLSVAALLLLQQATFLALALVIVYAGAILVIYVFVLMCVRQEPPAEHDQSARAPFLAVLVGFALLGSILQLALTPLPQSYNNKTQEALTDTGTAMALAQELFNHHVAAFEIAGVILLIAAVGAIAIMRAPRITEEKSKRIT